MKTPVIVFDKVPRMSAHTKVNGEIHIYISQLSRKMPTVVHVWVKTHRESGIQNYEYNIVYIIVDIMLFNLPSMRIC